jgi:Recombination endonuclease VII
VLQIPYERWVAVYGEFCGICGAIPGPRRRLDRDHDHRTGLARGLLCHRCNRALPPWITEVWLNDAATYLAREPIEL